MHNGREKGGIVEVPHRLGEFAQEAWDDALAKRLVDYEAIKAFVRGVEGEEYKTQNGVGGIRLYSVIFKGDDAPEGWTAQKYGGHMPMKRRKVCKEARASVDALPIVQPVADWLEAISSSESSHGHIIVGGSWHAPVWIEPLVGNAAIAWVKRLKDSDYVPVEHLEPIAMSEYWRIKEESADGGES